MAAVPTVQVLVTPNIPNIVGIAMEDSKLEYGCINVFCVKNKDGECCVCGYIFEDDPERTLCGACEI